MRKLEEILVVHYASQTRQSFQMPKLHCKVNSQSFNLWSASFALVVNSDQKLRSGLCPCDGVLTRESRCKTYFFFMSLYLPSLLVPLVGLVFPAIAMASLFLYIEKEQLS